MIGREALAVLAVRDYRLYWTGNVISKLGTEMQFVAVAWQIYALTGQPLSLGIVGLLRAGPALVMPILGGAVADSVDRRKLLIATQLAQVTLSVTIAWATLTDHVSLAGLYAFVLIAATLSGFEGPARGTVTPALVPRELIGPAVALNLLFWSAAGIVGPALGGLALGAFGVGWVYAIDAVSFFAILLGLLAIRTPLLVPELPPEERGLAGHGRRLRQGFGFVRAQPVLLGLMALDCAAMVLGAAWLLFPVFAKDVYHVGPEGLGLLAAAPAAGAVIGAALMTLVGYPRRPGVVVLWSIAAYGLCVAGFGLAPSFWLGWAFLAGTGVADTISMTLRQSIRLFVTPDELRGRVGGINYVFAVAGTQLGEFESGVAAQLFGAQRAVAAGGLLCMLLVALSGWRFPAIAAFRHEEGEGAEPQRA